MNKSKSLNKIQEWDESAARHILSRTHFGFTKSDVECALSFSLDDYVDNHLLKSSPLPNPPGNWVNTIPNENNEEAFEKAKNSQAVTSANYFQIEEKTVSIATYRECG